MKRSRLVLVKVILMSVALSMLGSLALAAVDAAETPLQSSIAGKVLRFHVLANSDSEVDQELKLKVRDSVGEFVQSKLDNSENLEETMGIVSQNLEEVIRTAEDTLREEGCRDRVTARIGLAEFPEKTYGDYTFPAGKYQALELVIGAGEGHNWWCVLYPNMCFRGSMYEAVSDEADEALREVLSPEEYRDVLESGNYKIRFKLLDWLRK